MHRSTASRPCRLATPVSGANLVRGWTSCTSACRASTATPAPSSSEVMAALGTTGLQGNRADRGGGILGHLALEKHLLILPTLAQEAGLAGKEPAAMWEALMAATFDLPYTGPKFMAQITSFAPRVMPDGTPETLQELACRLSTLQSLIPASANAPGAGMPNAPDLWKHLVWAIRPDTVQQAVFTAITQALDTTLKDATPEKVVAWISREAGRQAEGGSGRTLAGGGGFGRPTLPRRPPRRPWRWQRSRACSRGSRGSRATFTTTRWGSSTTRAAARSAARRARPRPATTSTTAAVTAATTTTTTTYEPRGGFAQQSRGGGFSTRRGASAAPPSIRRSTSPAPTCGGRPLRSSSSSSSGRRSCSSRAPRGQRRCLGRLARAQSKASPCSPSRCHPTSTWHTGGTTAPRRTWYPLSPHTRPQETRLRPSWRNAGTLSNLRTYSVNPSGPAPPQEPPAEHGPGTHKNWAALGVYLRQVAGAASTAAKCLDPGDPPPAAWTHTCCDLPGRRAALRRGADPRSCSAA
jgi:hypothetical protein